MKLFKLLIIFLLSSHFAYSITGARYLIIAPDNFVSTLQPLADWKTKKGVKATIVPLSVTGSSASQIKNYIINAYNTWQIRPEYILLAGFGNVLAASGSSDDYYANISGNYRIELSIGRLPANDVTACNLMVAKILAFERTPYLDDTTWYKKATTIIREDNPPDAYYQNDCRYIRNLMLNAGYTKLDSFLSTSGHNSTNVTNAFNDGRSFIIYRGHAVTTWWSPFNNVNPANLTNGYKMPVVITGSCATLSLTSTGYFGDRFLKAGTATAPKCAIAYFGTSGVGSSMYRSSAVKGFFRSLFTESTFVLGDVTKRAKFILDSTYSSQARYNEWNLFGDPELNLWTGVPRSLTVLHDTIISADSQNYTVTVRINNDNLPNALVCLMQDSTIYEYGRTDGHGEIIFTITPRNLGTISLTVTAQNAIPYEKYITVIAAGINQGTTNLALFSHTAILDQSRPNPMTSEYTRITYTITKPCNASLRIYDVTGKLVKTLFNEFKNSGEYNINWDGRDNFNHKVADGIYFYTLETPDQQLTRKLILTKK